MPCHLDWPSGSRAGELEFALVRCQSVPAEQCVASHSQQAGTAVQSLICQAAPADMDRLPTQPGNFNIRHQLCLQSDLAIAMVLLRSTLCCVPAGCKLPKQGLHWSVKEPSVDAESSLVLHWLIACMCQHNPAQRPTALTLVQQVSPRQLSQACSPASGQQLRLVVNRLLHDPCAGHTAAGLHTSRTSAQAADCSCSDFMPYAASRGCRNTC